MPPEGIPLGILFRQWSSKKTRMMPLPDSLKGALKMQDRKMQDLKMQDQIAGDENAGPENGGPSRNAASLCS